MWALFCFELKNRFPCITTILYSLLSHSGSGAKQWVIHIKHLHQYTWGLISLSTWQDPHSSLYFQLEWSDGKNTMISIIKTCFRGIYSCHWNSDNTRQKVRFYSHKQSYSLTFFHHGYTHSLLVSFADIFSIFFTLFAQSVERGGIVYHVK